MNGPKEKERFDNKKGRWSWYKKNTSNWANSSKFFEFIERVSLTLFGYYILGPIVGLHVQDPVAFLNYTDNFEISLDQKFKHLLNVYRQAHCSQNLDYLRAYMVRSPITQAIYKESLEDLVRHELTNPKQNCITFDTVMFEDAYAFFVEEYRKKMKKSYFYPESSDCNLMLEIIDNRSLDQILNGGKSVSEEHLLKYLQTVRDINENYFYCPYLIKLYRTVNKKVEQLEQEGYVVFFHGQRKKYLLSEQIKTLLWSVIHEQLSDDFLHMHVEKDISSKDLNLQKNRRKQLLEDGRARNSYNDRKYLLFLNSSFFGNSTNLGSSSANYVSQNFNQETNGPPDIYSIFKDYGLHDIFVDYYSEIEKLAEEHESISRFGNMILIAVPKENLNELVYAAHPGGAKKKVRTGLKRTDDINQIIDGLRNHPEMISNTDQIEFCMVMTQDENGGLNPKSGIKVIPFITGDQQEVEAYEKKRLELFARIEKDVRKVLSKIKK